MTASEMSAQLQSLGLRKAFRPLTEPESGALLLLTRRPATISGDRLAGTEIAREGKMFRVWTNQTRKARLLAAQHGLTLRSLDGECDLWIPAELADALLPKLGARVGRELSEEAKEALRQRLAQARNGPVLRQKRPEEGTSSLTKPQPAPLPLIAGQREPERSLGRFLVGEANTTAEPIDSRQPREKSANRNEPIAEQ